MTMTKNNCETMTERDYSRFDGGKWVKLLIKDPSKSALCDWRKLNGTRWRDLLKKRPEFAAKCGEFGGWEMMDAHDWHRLLVDQPQFWVHCDLGRLEKEGLLEGVLRCRPELGDKVDKSGWSTEKWLWILSLCPNNAELARQCDKWDEFPVDRVCDLLCDHPGLLTTCPDKVLRKLRLGHWAKLYRFAAPIPYVVDKRPHGLNNMTCVVADKMRELGVAAEVTHVNGKGVMIGDFEWCCPHHWAGEYGSVFHRFREYMPREMNMSREMKIRHIAENSAMNPYGEAKGRYSSDIHEHVRWLKALAADFAAMAAEASKTVPQDAEEYALIAEAADYEIRLLRCDDEIQGLDDKPEPRIKIAVLSFSYPRGMPDDPEEDYWGGFVFDCRCMPDPHDDVSLRGYSGLDKPVEEFFEKHRAEVDRFLDAAESLVRQSIDAYMVQGRDHLQVAFGCYGGHHRSVYLAERFAERLAGIAGVEVEVTHAARQYWSV